MNLGGHGLSLNPDFLLFLFFLTWGKILNLSESVFSSVNGVDETDVIGL